MNYHNPKIISAVDLKPEQDAQLIANGYEPIPVLGKAAVAPGWTSSEITAERIAAERAAYPEAKSAGLRTGKLVGIDIDIVDGEHTLKLVELAFQILGDTPLGRTGSKGIMLAYRNETPVRKSTIAGKGAQVE